MLESCRGWGTAVNSTLYYENSECRKGSYRASGMEIKGHEVEKSPSDRHKKLKVVVVGIVVRLVGLVLIFLGDGHESLWAKALVIVGVIISVTGIGILRYLLLSPMFRKVGTKIKSSP